MPTFSFLHGSYEESKSSWWKVFILLSDEKKVSLLLYSDSRFNSNKNNFILSASMTKDFRLPSFKVMNVLLILLFISSDTFHLVILFSYFIILFTFRFLLDIVECIFILDFRSLCRSLRRKKIKWKILVNMSIAIVNQAVTS